jgi:hypothetical protein
VLSAPDRRHACVVSLVCPGLTLVWMYRRGGASSRVGAILYKAYFKGFFESEALSVRETERQLLLLISIRITVYFIYMYITRYVICVCWRRPLQGDTPTDVILIYVMAVHLFFLTTNNYVCGRSTASSDDTDSALSAAM